MADLSPEASYLAADLPSDTSKVLLQNHRTMLRRQSEDLGAQLLSKMVEGGATNSQIKYIESQLYNNTEPAKVHAIAKDFGHQLGGVEEVNVPGTITGAVGNFKEHPVMGTIESALMPLGMFGKTAIARGPILGKASKVTGNMLGNEILSFSSKAAVDPLINPETSPWLNMGANMLAFGGQAVLAKAGANQARRAVLNQIEKGAALPAIGDIIQGGKPRISPPINPLANETGALSINPGAVSAAGAALWEKAAGSKIQASVDYLSRLPLLPEKTRLSKWIGGNTARELFVPREDLMPKNIGRSMYNTRIEQARVAQSLQDIQVKIQELPLNLKEEFYRVIKGGMDVGQVKDPANVPVIANMLDPYFNAVTQSKRKLMPKARHEALYQDQLDKSLMKLLAEDIDNPEFQLFKNSWQGDLTTTEGTQKFLDAIITNQHTMFPSESVTNLAKDLYDLGARTGSEVVTKHKGAFEKLLFSKIKAQPGVAILEKDLQSQAARIHADPMLSPKEKVKALKDLDRGYMKVPGNKMFEGMVVERHTAEGIKDLDIAQSAGRRIWNTYFLSPWKTAKAVLVPINKLRDATSNMIFNDVAGAYPLSPFNVPVYTRALKEMKTNGQLNRDFAYYSGGDSTNWVNVEIGPMIQAMKHGSGALEVPLKLLYDNKFTKLMYDTSAFVDHWAKLAKFSHNLDNGMSKSDAAIDAIQTVGDHMRQTRATKAIRDTAMPFFGWQVHAIKQMGHGLIHHPVRTAKYFTIPYFMQQEAVKRLNMSEDEWKEFRDSLPEHLKTSVAGIPTAVPMPYRDEQGKIQMVDMSWWIPGLQDMGEMQRNSKSLSFMQNPAITLFADLRSNKKFSGAPIWNEWEDTSTKAGKMLSHIAQQMTPSWTPGVGTSWDKTVNALNDNYVGDDKQSLAQALGSQYGWRVTPVDQAGQFTKNQARINSWRNEANTMMKKELSKTSDPKKQDQIIQQYQDIFNHLDQEAQGGEE